MMKRRIFLKYCICALAFFSIDGMGKILECADSTLKFAVISDIHPDIMYDGDFRLRSFLAEAEKNDVDFIIELGDFCYAKEENRAFLSVWNRSVIADKYHVLGNHDMDQCSKEEYMRFVGMNTRYYSFDKGDFHFIVLDPNNMYINGKYIAYNKGNYFRYEKNRDYVDKEQLDWLVSDLKGTDKRCILFSHECLENVVKNGDVVRGILENENKSCGFKKVVAAFSGHNHTNYTREINGIQYIQLNSASYQWVGEKYACPGRFNEGINTKRPAIKYTVPYKDPLYAIITLTHNSLSLKGRISSFIPPTPTDLGIPDEFFLFPLVPWIKDFKMKF